VGGVNGDNVAIAYKKRKIVLNNWMDREPVCLVSLKIPRNYVPFSSLFSMTMNLKKED
jgi:hypothetical protein